MRKSDKILKKFAIFACRPNEKTPACKNDYKNAQFNLDCKYITSLGYNLGISCRQSNLLVIDCDVDEEKGYDGVSVIQELEFELGKLPKTLTQTTPRGGKHYIFSDEGITQPKGKLDISVDVKWNGYILAAPSSVKGKSYQFVDGVDEEGNPIIAKLPKAWLDYINKTQPPTQASGSSSSKVYTKQIFEGDFKKMFTQCLFIRHCVESADILTEPEWHLFACVLGSLSNGLEIFDYFSQPHADYNPYKTIAKFNNSKKYNVNCETIRGVAEECKNCKFQTIERE